jgi:glycine dehydrogenase subunit 1
MDQPFFHEFIVCCPDYLSVDAINQRLLEEGILGGYNLENDYPELPHCMLIAVTEMNTRDEIERLCEVLSEVSHA